MQKYLSYLQASFKTQMAEGILLKALKIAFEYRSNTKNSSMEDKYFTSW